MNTDTNINVVAYAVITAGLVVVGIAAITLLSPDKSTKQSQSPSTTSEPTFIKDPITKCQYISANGAMYPRLDDRRVHICSDLAKYHFNPEG